jgi:hypothetical protein
MFSKYLYSLLLIGWFVTIPTFATGNKIQPIKGTFINLAYQDVRNKYMDPQYFDNTDPDMWKAKVRELHDMGIEYLVFMAIANEGQSYYPSKIMPWVYDKKRESPVDAIMDEADHLKMKVFMSIGWAQNQDDDLRKPEIKQRQLDIMKEVASIYGHRPSFYGWYLPVEDCLCPAFADHAVTAVNELSQRARALTPAKKIMISPYGIYESAFEDPAFEKQLAKLKVDIIAYQDEVGCVREPFPISNLKKHWKLLRDIHQRLHIELWANCESFTWEGATNDRTSALIPAAFPRLLSQLAIASQAPVDNIISFSVCGIIDSPNTNYHLGQPVWSQKVYDDYKAWRNGDEYWSLFEATLMGRLKNAANTSMSSDKELFDNQLAEENMNDVHWVKFEKGYHEIVVDMKDQKNIQKIFMRLLNYHLGNIGMPLKVYLYLSDQGDSYRLAAVKDAPYFPNTNHDAWIDGIFINQINKNARYLKIAFNAPQPVYMDEIYINPSYEK